MTTVSRRTFLATAATAATTFRSGAKAQPVPAVRWWDHFGALQKFHPKFAKDFSARTGIPVEFTYYELSRLGQALTLAKQSNQLPDVHTTAGLEFPTAALVAEGWFLPIDLPQPARDRLGRTVVEGIHSFNGKAYSFPLFTAKQYSAALWFNNTMAAAAGFDPASPPRSYDAIRAACASARKARPGAFGYTLALSNAQRMAEHINDLAQAAGVQGPQRDALRRRSFRLPRPCIPSGVRVLHRIEPRRAHGPG